VTVSAGHRASEALGILERNGGDTGMGTTTGRSDMERTDRM
jgi:hypothetical protein